MDRYDLLVIGGGINGAAVARDAAGRGLKVLLVEKDDLAAHTSSASSKLIHGGLRYLEHYDFRLVRESLLEREVMLRIAPHLVQPLEFILPDPPGGRPWWMIRIGLWIYDLLAGRCSLPRSRGLKRGDPRGDPLKPGFHLLSYWDAWTDDSRLVVANAVDATERGAEIATRTALVSARRESNQWTATLSDGREIAAAKIVNAAGPWVSEVLSECLGVAGRSRVRLVKGSHICVPRLHNGNHAFLLQQPDRRVVFVLPYGRYNLIGTTDVAVASPDEAAISDAEVRYLCDAANLYFSGTVAPGDQIWAYAGIRALYDDGAADAQSVTRDYKLELDTGPGAPLLSVFGGKITTARALAADALDMLKVGGIKFTATSPLPGGEITPGFNAWLAELAGWMAEPLLARLSRAYGTRLDRILDGVDSMEQLGRHFGAGLYEVEVRHLVEREFARTAEDVLWRRTKLGLAMTPAEQAALAAYVGR